MCMSELEAAETSLSSTTQSYHGLTPAKYFFTVGESRRGEKEKEKSRTTSRPALREQYVLIMI